MKLVYLKIFDCTLSDNFNITIQLCLDVTCSVKLIR